jgi:Domain of unknown function (DUF4281)
MSLETLFSICNTLVLPGWLLLMIAPRWPWTGRIITGIIVTILCLIYAVLLSRSFDPATFQNFTSLAGIKQLFTNDTGLLAGWIHYLAFDLMTGYFIVTDARKNKVKHGFVIPCLLFCFMLGPVGLLLYFITRLIVTKQYFTAPAR